ncbi:hypothetical protein MKZ02_15870 [Pseudobacillus sp. FSL P4-0506]
MKIATKMINTTDAALKTELILVEDSDVAAIVLSYFNETNVK